MKKDIKRLSAIFLAAIMIFTMCGIAASAKTQLYTEKFLADISESKKLHATVTSHSYDGRTDKMDMEFYDDLNTDSICCVLNDKGIKAVYRDGNISCLFTRFFLYVSVPANDIPFMNDAFDTVEQFQSLIETFLEQYDLNDFYSKVTTETKNGETYTCEKLTGKLISVSGTFVYNSKGELCEVFFTDTLGESISFTLENVETDFDNAVFNAPKFCINISFLWNIIKLFFAK